MKVVRSTIVAMSLLAANWAWSAQIPHSAVGRGLFAFNQGQYFEAIAHFTQAIEQGERDPRCYYFRGIAQSRIGQLEAAREDFRQGAQLEAQGLGQLVGQSLQRIQGGERLELERFRRTALIAARRSGSARPLASGPPTAPRQPLAAPSGRAPELPPAPTTGRAAPAAGQSAAPSTASAAPPAPPTAPADASADDPFGLGHVDDSSLSAGSPLDSAFDEQGGLDAGVGGQVLRSVFSALANSVPGVAAIREQGLGIVPGVNGPQEFQMGPMMDGPGAAQPGFGNEFGPANAGPDPFGPDQFGPGPAQPAPGTAPSDPGFDFGPPPAAAPAGGAGAADPFGEGPGAGDPFGEPPVGAGVDPFGGNAEPQNSGSDDLFGEGDGGLDEPVADPFGPAPSEPTAPSEPVAPGEPNPFGELE